MSSTVLQSSSVYPFAVATAADMQSQTVPTSFVALAHLSIPEAQELVVARADAVSLEVPKWHFNGSTGGNNWGKLKIF